MANDVALRAATSAPQFEKFSLYGRRLIGGQKFIHRHAPDQACMGLARQHRTQRQALLNNKVDWVVAIPHDDPLIGFIASIGARAKYQASHLPIPAQ
jgi:hypothetical protein